MRHGDDTFLHHKIYISLLRVIIKPGPIYKSWVRNLVGVVVMINQ